MSNTVRTEAQLRAEQKYNEKRLKKPAIPAIRLTEEEHEFCNAVFQLYGKTKKEAVLEGLFLLRETLK